GIGADGLMVAEKSDHADMKMIYHNQDGTIAPMCGNGLRCFGRYIHEHKLVDKDKFTVETLAGILPVDVSKGYDRITIGLDSPEFDLSYPDVRKSVKDGGPVELNVSGKTYEMHVLFLGTLHGVIFTDEKISPEVAHGICHHEFFPKAINVNFTKVKDRKNISVRTFERGVGYTLACGTGVCAAQVMASRLGYTENGVHVKAEGGNLYVEDLGEIYLTGPAAFIAKGEMEIG
ncbi:MAG TPA: diaminopimelate epimerase, partial [Bacteroidales bacterium]|nr:diaminopimelate epimerase [Bacteroidales bacterium]